MKFIREEDVMYIVLCEKCDWIYTIVSDLDEAMTIARMLNDEEKQRYHYYVVEECTVECGQVWLNSWRKVMSK